VENQITYLSKTWRIRSHICRSMFGSKAVEYCTRAEKEPANLSFSLRILGRVQSLRIGMTIKGRTRSGDSCRGFVGTCAAHRLQAPTRLKDDRRQEKVEEEIVIEVDPLAARGQFYGL
jgi:hypothetical protein